MADPHPPLPKGEESLTPFFKTERSAIDNKSWLSLPLSQPLCPRGETGAFVSPLQGSISVSILTQGVALGWYVTPLRGF
jgi:hypothetical protein